ncbi:MAG: two-component regulator propeller domain-containing protein, partial [Saprospiraceae bacterium]|nr:two-component regulator propeller domain-containing protein [Saprospiraceae bacterium]
EGVYWIGTRGETCRYDGEQFRRFTKPDGTSFTNVRCIIQDRSGNIWLGGNDGLWRHTTHMGKGTKIQVAVPFTGFIYEDSDGNIWTSSESPGARNRWVLTRYDHSRLHHPTPYSTQILIKEDMFFGILEDREGNIWLGTLNGVGRYNGQTFEWFRDRGIKE